MRPSRAVLLSGDRARYAARVLLWSAADREAHEKMGSDGGWGKCAGQLDALVARLRAFSAKVEPVLRFENATK